MKLLVRRIVLFGPPALLVGVVGLWMFLPWPVFLKGREPGRTSLMQYRVDQARDRGEDLELRQTWVPLEEISRHMVRAVILAEDGRFREHGGVDWHALAEEVGYEGQIPLRLGSRDDWSALLAALGDAWRRRDELRGRSTITQQLAKNLYWDPERSLGRKIGELVVARRLERFLSKDRILELYLNTVELGPGIFGVEEAALHYFGTSAANLTPYQAASLTATLPHPLTSNPDHRPGRMAWRRDVILQRMRGGGGDPAIPIPEAPPELEVPTELEEGPLADGDTAAADADTTGRAPDTTGAAPDSAAVPDTTGAVPDTTGVGPDTTGVGRDTTGA